MGRKGTLHFVVRQQHSYDDRVSGQTSLTNIFGWPCLGMQGKGQHELAVLDLVRNKAEHGNPQSVLNVIDDHAWLGGASSLMNIGDRKGAIVDTVVEECQPKVAGIP